MLSQAAIVRHSLSANHIVRCFKLKILEHNKRYQFDFLLPLKLEKYHAILGYDSKILLTNQFAGLFIFNLFDLLNLMPGDHFYIVRLFHGCYFLSSLEKYFLSGMNFCSHNSLSILFLFLSMIGYFLSKNVLLFLLLSSPVNNCWSPFLYFCKDTLSKLLSTINHCHSICDHQESFL